MADFISDSIIGLRHWLHAHPELSGMETRTREYLMRYLRENTALEITDRGRWFFALYRGKGAGRSPIAFRADMDALPVPEEQDRPYSSVNPGVSHRCGHDGHCAALAGLARMLTEYGSERDVYLIFQHAEEIGGGGRECASLLEQAGIGEVYACHNWSGFERGSILIRRGTCQCASLGMTLRFTGRSAHASQPEDGISPVPALTELAEEIERVNRENSGGPLCMATVVYLNAGSRNFGMMACAGEIAATLRAEREEDLVSLEERLRSAGRALAERDGLKMEENICDRFPETRSDAEKAEKVRACAERLGMKVAELERPFRASEDFGYYLEKCPGAIFYIGNGMDYPAIHTTGYDFPDDNLEPLYRLYYALVNDMD